MYIHVPTNERSNSLYFYSYIYMYIHACTAYRVIIIAFSGSVTSVVLCQVLLFESLNPGQFLPCLKLFVAVARQLYITPWHSDFRDNEPATLLTLYVHIVEWR